MYFLSRDLTTFDATLEQRLTVTQERSAFDVAVTGLMGTYTDRLFTEDVRTLVSFTYLVGVGLRQPVARTDYVEVQEIIRKAWIATDIGNLI